MDTDTLALRARALQTLLTRYAPQDSAVQALQEALAPWVEGAISGRITAAQDWRDIPGDRLFSEGPLQGRADLERAYAEFKIEITGGESPALRKLRSRMSGGQ